LKDQQMKKIELTLAVAGLSACFNTHAQSDLFGSIQDWTGTGTNQAAFEFDFENGSANDALLWGYRWDGSATGEQMFDAIVAGDPRLYAEVSAFDTGYGTALFGFGFAASGDVPITLSPTLSFNSQHLAYADSYDAVDDSRMAVNAGDLWEEGWYYSGYWAYWLSTDSALTAAGDDASAWSAAWGYGTSMTSEVLENGDVNAFTFDNYSVFGYDAPTPNIPVAVEPAPEPATSAFLFMGGTLFLCIRRHHFLTKKLS
jgi:hypothetical protein